MKKTTIALLVFTFLAIPLLVSAQDATQMEIIVCNVLQIAKNLVIIIGIGLAIIMLIWGGIKYLTAGGDAAKAESAKKMLVYALIGIIIVVAAGAILLILQQTLVGVGFQGIFYDPCPYILAN